MSTKQSLVPIANRRLQRFAFQPVLAALQRRVVAVGVRSHPGCPVGRAEALLDRRDVAIVWLRGRRAGVLRRLRERAGRVLGRRGRRPVLQGV
jgi:hypothetical protein